MLRYRSSSVSADIARARARKEMPRCREARRTRSVRRFIALHLPERESEMTVDRRVFHLDSRRILAESRPHSSALLIAHAAINALTTQPPDRSSRLSYTLRAIVSARARARAKPISIPRRFLVSILMAFKADALFARLVRLRPDCATLRARARAPSNPQIYDDHRRISKLFRDWARPERTRPISTDRSRSFATTATAAKYRQQ